MQENNICPIKISKVKFEIRSPSFKNILHGGFSLSSYGAPVWAETIEKTSYRKKLIRVQILFNITTAKAYRTVSNDELCIVTGKIPIHIKIKETAKALQNC